MCSIYLAGFFGERSIKMKNLLSKIDIFKGSLIAISSVLFLIGFGIIVPVLALVIYSVRDYRQFEAQNERSTIQA